LITYFTIPLRNQEPIQLGVWNIVDGVILI
jgi:hypothetical protein